MTSGIDEVYNTISDDSSLSGFLIICCAIFSACSYARRYGWQLIWHTWAPRYRLVGRWVQRGPDHAESECLPSVYQPQRYYQHAGSKRNASLCCCKSTKWLMKWLEWRLAAWSQGGAESVPRRLGWHVSFSPSYSTITNDGMRRVYGYAAEHY